MCTAHLARSQRHTLVRHGQGIPDGQLNQPLGHICCSRLDKVRARAEASVLVVSGVC
jgi:hypothetical protein